MRRASNARRFARSLKQSARRAGVPLRRYARALLDADALCADMVEQWLRRKAEQRRGGGR